MMLPFKEQERMMLINKGKICGLVTEKYIAKREAIMRQKFYRGG